MMIGILLTRAAAHKALRESEERYRLVVENADEGIIVSQATHIKFVNPKVVKELGYTEEELNSRPFIEFIHPDDREMVIRHHLDGISGKEVSSTISYRIFDRNGTMKWVEVTGVRIVWEGEPCALLFVKDISDRKKRRRPCRNRKKNTATSSKTPAKGSLSSSKIVSYMSIRGLLICSDTRIPN